VERVLRTIGISTKKGGLKIPTKEGQLKKLATLAFSKVKLWVYLVGGWLGYEVKWGHKGWK